MPEIFTEYIYEYFLDIVQFLKYMTISEPFEIF